jgi:hypothetical protein
MVRALATAAPNGAGPRRKSGALLWAAFAFGVMAVLCAALAVLDPRLLESGENIWLKPVRFALAFAIHLLTLVWITKLTGRDEVRDDLFSAGIRLQVIIAAIEFACIALQAGRGVPSHFNLATPFDRLVFTIMGLGTAGLMLGFLLMIAGLLRRPGNGFAAACAVAGIGFAILGGLVGVIMVMPDASQSALLKAGQKLSMVGNHAVGEPSQAKIPFFGWDRIAGDWRVPHFIGLHGMQLFPLLAWLRGMRGGRAGFRPLGITVAGYALLFAWSTWLTVNARSIFSPDLDNLAVVALSAGVLAWGFQSSRAGNWQRI